MLLFDEGNVLAKSRTLLEKLRNMFMNTSGYMLVLTGTPDLFPVMDEVFSPIIRQFKKINVGRFADKNETRQCILRPLEKLGVVHPEGLFERETYSEVREIHELTGGKPYEVQLLCHMLFRRLQRKQARKMKLDLSVLEDVRTELETSQDISARPLLVKIRSLGREELSALPALCECEGRATFDQIWAMEYILNGEKRWKRNTLAAVLRRLLADGVFETADGIVKFAGDDFDRIYTKYYAREKAVTVSFFTMPPDLVFQVKLSGLTERISGLAFALTLFAARPPAELEELAARMAAAGAADDVFAEAGLFGSDLYELFVRFRGCDNVPVVRVRFAIPAASGQAIFYVKDPGDTSPIEKCAEEMGRLRQRALEVGAEIDARVIRLRVPPFDTLKRNVLASADERLRERFAAFHHDAMVEEYSGSRDPSEVLFHALVAKEYTKNPEAKVANNLGYVLMSGGDLGGARTLLERSISGYEGSPAAALPIYNLAVLNAKEGRLTEARRLADQCIAGIEKASSGSENIMCLVVPKLNEGRLEFEEVGGPMDLLETAKRMREVLSSVGGVGVAS